MGKNYYCEYCCRSFSDSGNNRKKHLISAHHQRMRREHYDSFKDASTILQEEKMKNPCRKFFETGTCDFGPRCRYSHLTSAEKNALVQKIENKGSKTKEVSKPLLSSWLAKLSKNTKSEPLLEQYLFQLPEELQGRKDLSPSLLPLETSGLNPSELKLPSWG